MGLVLELFQVLMSIPFVSQQFLDESFSFYFANEQLPQRSQWKSSASLNFSFSSLDNNDRKSSPSNKTLRLQNRTFTLGKLPFETVPWTLYNTFKILSKGYKLEVNMSWLCCSNLSFFTIYVSQIYPMANFVSCLFPEEIIVNVD